MDSNSNKIMKKCWAHAIGGCDGMSGEHIFSSAIFKAGCSCPIVVEGVQRIRRGEPTYGAEKSNILCRHHNSLLSPLDETVGRLARFQASANEENFNESLYVEGELLERWLLKTVINIAAAGWAGPEKLSPSIDIVRAIFGHGIVPAKLGLYSVDGVDPNHRPSGGTSFVPLQMLSPKGPILVGAYVTIHGMPLLASFHTQLANVLEAVEIPGLSTRFSNNGLRHLYHPGAIVMSRQRGMPVAVGLSWNGILRFADGTTASFPRPSQP